MKKHWFSIIGYILGILILWACIIIFEQPFLLMLLFLLIILPALSIWFFHLAISKIKVNIYSEVVSVENGNTVPFVLECENNSFFPLFACIFDFKLQNFYKPNDVVHKLSLPLLPRKKNRIQIPVETAICGMLSLEAKALYVSDYLHFITKEIPLPLKMQVPVMPATTDVALPSTAPVSDGLEEFTESDHKGNLSSDIKEIREYRPGDRLQRIHWKLSAKLDDLLVKEMAHTTILSLVVLPECDKERIQDTAIVLRSVMEQLWKREERYEVCLYNAAACEFSYFLITEESQIMETLIHFFYMPLYEGTDEAKEAYFASAQKSAVILQICGTELKRIDSETIIG
ncbi:MAG: DUF58 domain-containing protein [Lachnospiraceae bacterium]|nr:DUF58 domain-containing protein [Lachnospiraceae bacterium]